MRYTPLFQVMFALQNVPSEIVKLAGLTVRAVEIDPGTAKFDLTLFLFEEGEALRGVIEYNTELFEAATITRLIGHFRTLLEGIVSHPDDAIATLLLLTAPERQRLLREWNDTPLDYPHEACIHALFERQVERTPDATACLCEDQQLTYRELNQRANQVAHYLRAAGVGPEVRVGICIERSLAMVVGLLGILKAGGAYVPLDPAYPKERLAFMVEDAQVSVLLTQQQFLEAIPLPTHCAPTIICLDTDWDVIARERTTNPAHWVAAEHPAYVIYTSGSTGLPKGVLGLHGATLNCLHWMWAAYPFTVEEVCCQKTSLNFVDAVREIFGPLLQGIPTVIIPDAAVKDAQQLIRTLASNHVTRIALVPSLLQVILDTVTDLHSHLPHLKYWVTGGEALPLELCQHFHQCLPHSILLNLYGASEAAGDSTCYEIKAAQELQRVPIGRPIANTQSYVLDARLQPVPMGIPGELYIGGDGLARGYLNRAELTAERFMPNPWSTTPGERLYKTGDLVRYLPDGNLEFLGRLDHRVKVRGFRIELREIEIVLSQHPGVQQTVILAREDGAGERHLVAYIVSKHEPAPTVRELRHFLGEKLPDYMIPAVFVTLPALPLTPNGKIDHRALPAPAPAGPPRDDPLIAPRTEIEEALMEIWTQVLKRDQISMHDNFFDLGGHSLLATQVMARVHNTLQLEVPLRTLFEAPTIAELGVAIEEIMLQEIDRLPAG
jgi:amino acid adenylation domain-containing protein